MRLAGLSGAESCFATNAPNRVAIVGFERKKRSALRIAGWRNDTRHPCLFGMGVFALLAVLLALLGSAIWMAVTVWQAVGDVAIPAHGYIAMTLGIVFSLVIGCGL